MGDLHHCWPDDETAPKDCRCDIGTDHGTAECPVCEYQRKHASHDARSEDT